MKQAAAVAVLVLLGLVLLAGLAFVLADVSAALSWK